MSTEKVMLYIAGLVIGTLPAVVVGLFFKDAIETVFHSPRFAAGGFRDFTRIASSDPVMWRDIAIANRGALLKAIDLFSSQLGSLRSAVESEDADALYETFSRAKVARDQFSAILAARSER